MNQAERDLEDLLADVHRTDPVVARRYADDFAAKAEMLAQFPEAGRPRPEIAPNLRSTLVRPYVMFYRVAGDDVQILRILHGRQDLGRVLRAEGAE